MTAVIVAAVLLGAAVGRALPTKPEAGAAAQSIPSAPETAGSFQYFPSQYVNQATEAEEHIQAF
jgi:hypothetical protein